MTNEQAIKWLKDYIQNTPFQMEQHERAFEAAIQALSQESEIEENIIKYMKKYPNHVGNTDFWEGFYACRNVVLQLDDEEYAPKEQEPCDDAISRDFQIGDEVRIIGSDPIYDDCDVGWVIRNASEKVKTMYVMRNDGSAEEEAKAEWYKTGRHNAMLAEVIKALPSVTHKSGKWIPVSERLPEEDTNVLCWYEYFRYGNYNKMYQTYGVGTYFGRFGWAGDITGDQARVIAWMPLPKPYEPQESEDKG